MKKPKLSDQELDQVLSALPDIEPSAALMQRVAEIPLRHPLPVGLSKWWPFPSLLKPLLAWGAAAALGVAVGLVAPADDESGQQAALALSAVSLDDGAQWDELAELALAFDLDELDEIADAEGEP
jgi:hypothetical protein